MKCYVRIGSDTLDQAEECESIKDACAHYHNCAVELDNIGQQIDATIHIANSRDELGEDADYALSLGPRGGVQKTRC